ncbi:unnamed protein product [Camellia sinensis]
MIEDCNNAPTYNVRWTPVVTFRDIELDEGDFDEESSHSEPEIFQAKRESEVKARKGTCYRCLKGNKFTKKEAYIFCDAKYCSNCVLRAMGSMPKGRKCVTCIGYPIDESKRGNFRNCSRMLKRLLNDLKIQQILKAENFCEVNQLPPKKLKPGGAETHQRRSCSHLNVGGPIKADASNGNTQIFINGRDKSRATDVTAGRGPMASTKLVCAVLSLPVPSKSANPCGEQVNNLVSRAMPDYTEQRTLQKLLLIGYSRFGTSTIFKQVPLVPTTTDTRGMWILCNEVHERPYSRSKHPNQNKF